MKHMFLILTSVFSVIFTLSAQAELEAVKKFPNAAEKSKIVFTTGFDSPENAAAKLPEGYKIVPSQGRNGTTGLFYERTDPKVYRLYGTRLKDVIPNENYVASVWVRGEGLKGHGTSKNFAGLCVEYSLGGKWAGGFYHSISKLGSEWQQIKLPFRIPENATATITFYLAKEVTGKIWYDDAEVRTEAIAPALLLTRPDRLAFFGGDGKFQLHVENTVPKNNRILATVTNGGKTREMLLKSDDPDYQGDAGRLEPGPVVIRTKIADMDRKIIVAEDEFQLEARPAAEPPKNACTIDEYGRAVVNGKPFMPLGVYGFADEKNYQRLADAGFNCLQLYNSIGLRGNTDHKDDVKNVLDGMDLIDKYGLKLIFSVKDQFEHHGGRRKWAGVDGLNAVTEKVVETVKNHPALLAWYVSDEEMRQDVPLVLDLRRRVSKVDPWHPTWTLTYRYNELPYYGISGDLIGVDPYPISEQKKEQSIKLVKTAMDAGNSTGLPVWVVPQIFNWGVYRLKDKPEEFAKSHFPTLEEMRAMTLYAAALGAKGFVFYSNFDICQRYDKLLPGSGEREWPKVVEMVKSVKELEPFVLSTKKPFRIAVQSEPEGAVEAGALLDDAGNFRVIVIGTGGTAKGTFTLPGELLKLKREPLKSKFGKTKTLGNGRYEFTAEAVDSDVLE